MGSGETRFSWFLFAGPLFVGRDLPGYYDVGLRGDGLLTERVCQHRKSACFFLRRGEVSDYVLMEGRGFGFVTFKDPQNAQQFLEVASCYICIFET